MLQEIAIARHRVIERPRVDVSPEDVVELKKRVLRDTAAGVIPELKLPNITNDTDASIVYSGSWKRHSLGGCFNSDETFTA